MAPDTDTVAVLALDATDARLVDRWNCENLRLHRSGRLTTFGSDRHDGQPFTLDVWPAVARGERVDETADESVTQEWQNPVLRLASTATKHLPLRARQALGRPFRALGADLSFSVADAETMFSRESAAVSNWPGVVETPRLEYAWQVTQQAKAGDLSTRELRAETTDGLHAATDWLRRQSDRGVTLAGTHTHILDTAGHIYADDEASLRGYYELVDEVVGRLRAQVDELVVLSDHGMQVSFLGDDDPAEHSFDAFVSRTRGLDGLPDSVLDVRDWLEPQIGDSGAAVDAAVTHDQLSALGYVDD